MIPSASQQAGATADLKKARRRRSDAATASRVDRVPPHSMEAELGVLGCELISPNECVAEVVAKLKDTAIDASYDLRHQTIQRALIEMSESRQAIDIITLQQWLKDRQLLDEVGGLAYLSSLADAVPSSANLSY